MSFEEVERVLGFALPDSARKFPAWWSNNTGTHVGVSAWRDSGWKTSRVNLGSERVTFVRDDAKSPRLAPILGEVAISTSDETKDVEPGEAVFDALSSGAKRMVDDWAEERGLSHGLAIVSILNNASKARQRQLVDGLPFVNMPLGHDSTLLIREDRDAC